MRRVGISVEVTRVDADVVLVAVFNGVTEEPEVYGSENVISILGPTHCVRRKWSVFCCAVV